MGRPAILRRTAATVLLTVSAWAQAPLAEHAEWNRVGNSLLNFSLADLATGSVSRVWYSSDGRTLYATTASGKTFETTNFETWRRSSAVAAEPPKPVMGLRLPEPGAQLRGEYAFGKFVYRSQNRGVTWDNLTGFRSRSIVGTPMDTAASPRNPEEVVVASAEGVYRSLDGGKSWRGLNQGLPNFPAARILSLPFGTRGVQLELETGKVVEWQPGERQAWSPAMNPAAIMEAQLRQRLSTNWGARVTAIHSEGDTIYAGTSDGRIAISTDRGVTWLVPSPPISSASAVERFWLDPANPRVALAVLSGASGTRIVRTLTGGAFWDNVTTNLPDARGHGVTASSSTHAMYVATDQGVFYAPTGLTDPGGTALWQRLDGLPQASVSDVQLDPTANWLWAVVPGWGVYWTSAPHGMRDPQVVSSADLMPRAAAPGALMTVTGARVASAQAGELTVSVLQAGETDSQIQIPFEARGDTLSLSIKTAAGPVALPPFALASASPAIFVERDGSPFLFDASTGALLDAMNPAHSRTRIQIMASGLGRVSPDWPNGLEAPLDNPPSVVADVRVWLDATPVEVTRKVYASGYVGWYLVEIEIPRIVNTGPAELYLEVDGRESNRVRVYIQP